jgi:hypothetical protein
MIERIYERIYERILCEADVHTQDDMKHTSHLRALLPLAALCFDGAGGQLKSAILYSPDDVMKSLRKFKEHDDRYNTAWGTDAASQRTRDEAVDVKAELSNKAVEDAVRGIIQIKASDQPCWGAWEVVGSAAPGGADMARTVYGLAYAMSPSGIVMSDRISASRPAKAAWARVREKGERQALPFDDARNPKTPEPKDDCDLYRGKSGKTEPDKNPALQNAYMSMGWEKGMLNYLVASHDAFSNELAREDKRLPRALEKYLRYSLPPFFGHHYPGSDND